MIRKAELSDVNDIIQTIRPYHKESMFKEKRIGNEDRLFMTVHNSVMGDGWTTLLSITDRSISGILIAYENYSFYDDSEMDIDFYYIPKEYRGSGVSRELIKAIKNIAIKRKIGIMYCGCHSNMADGGKNNNLFVNLFKKYGFEETGTNLHLEIGY